MQGERTLFKRAKGAFYDTDLEPWLRGKGITHLLIAGVTTEVGFHDALQRGWLPQASGPGVLGNMQ